MAKIIKKKVKPLNDSKKDILKKEHIKVMFKLGYSVRIEKGVFKGGFCMLREQKLFLINKNLEQDKKINILVKNIAGIGIEGIFLKPNIRELVENESPENKLL